MAKLLSLPDGDDETPDQSAAREAMSDRAIAQFEAELAILRAYFVDIRAQIANKSLKPTWTRVEQKLKPLQKKKADGLAIKCVDAWVEQCTRPAWADAYIESEAELPPMITYY
ncbi:hypothetical protein LTR27_009095 [Elasticomyces elasticus]|nr:hypothetical protein LTR27_009095 [Elasticomyces elasticus]